MNTFFSILLFIAMGAVLAVLIIGLVGMARGGEFNRKYGNKLMRARVYLQGAALLCFVLAMLSRAGG